MTGVVSRLSLHPHQLYRSRRSCADPTFPIVFFPKLLTRSTAPRRLVCAAEVT